MSKPPPSDRTIEALLSSVAPVSLPPSAWGQDRLDWLTEPAPAWVWVSWPNRAAERMAGYVLAKGERVCIVSVQISPGQRWEPVVWRNAVTRRVESSSGKVPGDRV